MKTIKYLSILLLIISCKDDFEGPSLNDVFGPFELIQDFMSSADTINFEKKLICFFKQNFLKMNGKLLLEVMFLVQEKKLLDIQKI